MKFEKISKSSVKRTVKKEGSMKVWVALWKVSPAHLNDGWHLGQEITVINENDKLFVKHHSSVTELETWLNNFSIMNGNSELGHRPRFWITEKELNCQCKNNTSTFFENHGTCEWCTFIGEDAL